MSLNFYIFEFIVHVPDERYWNIQVSMTRRLNLLIRLIIPISLVSTMHEYECNLAIARILIFKSEDVRDIFTPIIDKIVKLVKKQVDAVRLKLNHDIAVCLFDGGFSFAVDVFLSIRCILTLVNTGNFIGWRFWIIRTSSGQVEGRI